MQATLHHVPAYHFLLRTCPRLSLSLLFSGVTRGRPVSHLPPPPKAPEADVSDAIAAEPAEARAHHQRRDPQTAQAVVMQDAFLLADDDDDDGGGEGEGGGESEAQEAEMKKKR